jgi:hypothetical protein
MSFAFFFWVWVKVSMKVQDLLGTPWDQEDSQFEDDTAESDNIKPWD